MVELNTSDNGSDIIVQAKNASDELIQRFEVGILFYKDGKIVGVESSKEKLIDPESTIDFKILYPYNHNTNEKIDFDNYKVFIVEAYCLKYVPTTETS